MDEKKGYIMGIRKVGLNSNEYNFVSDNSYKKQWGFIFEPDREKIIAAQLTYLDFHDWLHGNIYSTSGGGQVAIGGEH